MYGAWSIRDNKHPAKHPAMGLHILHHILNLDENSARADINSRRGFTMTLSVPYIGRFKMGANAKLVHEHHHSPFIVFGMNAR